MSEIGSGRAKLDFQALVDEENSFVQFEILSIDVFMAHKLECEQCKKIPNSLKENI